jgi:nucleoside-diphosphate-sugar epimerase
MPAAVTCAIPPGSKILVTGGTGFIGWQLCRRLCDTGLDVHATSRRALPRVAGQPVWWQVDTADLEAARRVFAEVKPDIVIHLAGQTGAQPDRNLVVPSFHSLAMSTVNVLSCAGDFGCRRVILVASLTEPSPSATAPIPGSPYAAAKWVGSTYGRMFHALYGTPVVILRPFMAYGPGQARTKLVPSAALSLINGEAPRVSSGAMRGDWVYIADVIDAFVAAIAVPGIEGRSVDLGTGKLTSIRELIETLVRTSESGVVPQFGAVADRPHEQETAADPLPAETYLGWRATTSLADGLSATMAWYREHAETLAQGNFSAAPSP